MNTEITTRPGVREIVAAHDAILQQYRIAFSALLEAEKIAKTVPVSTYWLPSLDEIARKSYGVREEKDAQKALKFVRQTLAKTAWHKIVDLAGFGSMMSAEDKRQFDRDLEKNVPDFNLENIQATASAWHAISGETFNKGIVDVFRKLSPKYRSNDAFKIAKKMILTLAVDLHGEKFSWYYDSRGFSVQDTLRDAIRIFSILDGDLAPKDYGGDDLTGIIATAWANGEQKVSTKFFEVRPFANGNLHVIFTRLDLIEKCNKIIAAHYGAVLPDGRKAA